jgi:hypothetical protein
MSKYIMGWQMLCGIEKNGSMNTIAWGFWDGEKLETIEKPIWTKPKNFQDPDTSEKNWS